MPALMSCCGIQYRKADGSLARAGVAGRAVFQAANCANCHGGTYFTNRAAGNLQDIGTLKPSSGSRLGGQLPGIDIPTLRDVWRSGPYLHDGSPPTLTDAVRAHNHVPVNDADGCSNGNTDGHVVHPHAHW